MKTNTKGRKFIKTTIKAVLIILVVAFIAVLMSHFSKEDKRRNALRTYEHEYGTIKVNAQFRNGIKYIRIVDPNNSEIYISARDLSKYPDDSLMNIEEMKSYVPMGHHFMEEFSIRDIRELYEEFSNNGWVIR